MDHALTVKSVSLLSGISAHTLRAWERRYGVVAPNRTETGRRVYSMTDVKKLKLLNQLVASGHAIGGIAPLKFSELQVLAHPAASLDDLESPVSPVIGEPQVDRCLSSVIRALGDYRLDLLEHELFRARADFSVRTLILSVLSSLMAEVGKRVQKGELGIAQEHALSALLRGHLGEIFRSVSSQSSRAGLRVVLSTAEGDFHEFGILMGAILCANRGLSVQYLGTNLPAPDLAEAALATHADLVLLGSTPLPPGTTVVPLQSYLSQLTTRLAPGTEVLVGGDCGFDLSKVRFNCPVTHLSSLAALDERLVRLDRRT